MTWTGFSSDGMANLDNFAGGGLAATGLDLLGMWRDPVGALATAGIGWLIEHLSFLREPLDWLAGNGDKIKAAVTTWNQVAADLHNIGEQQDRAVKSELPCWEQGTAAEKFRQSQGELAAEITMVSRMSAYVASEIATAGTITAAIRGMIRDLIALFIWEVIRNAVIALSTSVVSLGSSIAAFSAWAVGRGAAVLGKITQQLAKLVKLVTRVMSRVKGLFGRLGDALKRLGRFGRGGGTNAPVTQRRRRQAQAGRPRVQRRLRRRRQRLEEQVRGALEQRGQGQEHSATTSRGGWGLHALQAAHAPRWHGDAALDAERRGRRLDREGDGRPSPRVGEVRRVGEPGQSVPETARIVGRVSGTRPQFQPRKLVAASLFALAITVGSFLIMAVGNAVTVVAFALIICWLGYVRAVAGYRPKASRSALLPAMALGIATIFPANMGSHSLWLTAHGETLRCTATSIETHVHRRSPNTYSNGLQCGERQLTYQPSMYRTVYEVGAKPKIDRRFLQAGAHAVTREAAVPHSA